MIAKTHNMQWMRGDTTRIGISISGLDGEPDELTFSVKKYKTDTEYIIRKTLSNGIEPETAEEGLRYIVTIETADTEELVPSAYSYDLEAIINGDTITLLTGSITIAADVTRHNGEEAGV